MASIPLQESLFRQQQSLLTTFVERSLLQGGTQQLFMRMQ